MSITDDLLDDDLDAEFDDDLDDAEPGLASASAIALRDAILEVLRELVEQEQVEIEDDMLLPVADELTLAAHEGRDPRHALKKLRAALIESDNVEEVYADDRTLEAAFREALEA